MKKSIHILLSLTWFCPIFLGAQPEILSDAWSDPDFVERFTSTFLPITDQEPKITENEGELFVELAALLDGEQPQLATQRLEKAVLGETEERPVSAALNYTLGNLYLQEARFEEAAVQYQKSIDKFGNFRRAFKNLGLSYIQSGKSEEAIKALVKAVELGDGAGDTFGLLAYSYLNVGNPAAALEGYRQASLLNPTNREWRIGKAEALMRTERYREAIAEFKQLIQEQPTRNAYYTSIANAYLSLGDTDLAARYLEVLRRRGEAKAPALSLLGDIYINDGLSKLALKAYIEAINSGELSTSKSIRSLKALLQRGFYDDAGVYLAALDSINSDDFSEEQTREVLNLKAQLALAKGDNEEAAATLELVLEQDPMNGNALMLLGEFNQSRDDLENAIYYFQRAVSLTDFQRAAQLQLARIYVGQKEYQLAIRQLEAALEVEYSANVQDFLDAVKAVYNRSL